MKKSTGNQESMRNIGQERIRSIVVPACTQTEMNEVVSHVETKVTQIEALTTEIETQIAKSETLRQSILKKAFSGQLVPQDPSEEPASALLARIQAENAAHAVSANKTTNKKLANPRNKAVRDD